MSFDVRRIETDVAVLGSGAAGMMAAVKAHDSGTRVLLLGKGPTGRGTCSNMVAGAFSSSTAEYSVTAHREATLEAGRGINHLGLVKLVTAEAQGKLEELQRWGVPLRPVARGFRAAGPEVGLRLPGTAFADALRRIVREHGIESLPGFQGLELLLEGGAVVGVRGLAADGAPVMVLAQAVVLATGGACALYERNDNPPAITGDGYAMALRAGCRLRDMEFVQFYPLGLAQPGIPAFIVYPPYPPEARVLDSDGRDILGELGDCRDLSDATTRYRDTASLLFWQRHREGGVFLDLTGVEDARWSASYSLRVLGRSSFDFRRRLCPIAPIAHFFVGGVEVDDHMATSLPGLFGAGEVIGGLHGANRLGGNALSECVVCGTLAGASAATYARQAGRRERPRVTGWGDLPSLSARLPVPRYRELFRRVQAIAWEFAGVVRDAKGMARGLALLADIEGELGRTSLEGGTRPLERHRIGSALLVLRATLEAGLLRCESRGAFFRSDYPNRNDERWLRSLTVRLADDGRIIVEGVPPR